MVEVLARDREEFDALEERRLRILGERDHALDEVELGELPVQITNELRRMFVSVGHGDLLYQETTGR